ncbi:MAG: hypothetical protein OQJ97_12750 [Rhodospirillales bacterium]|nr:hypothetical protein [Rhodospirillales bacterium]
MFSFKKLTLCLALLGLLGGMTAEAHAKGYLARKAIELPDLKVGLGEAGFGMSQKKYEMETGKAYSLKIISTGRQECAFEAPKFFTFIWLRKIEAGGIEIKATYLYELEFEDDGEAELYFVPIKPGTYKFACRGLEIKGMTGEFIVK